ncbi:hypothetical protein CG709_05195 [Lachnotalea glycerini]|nr:hypothetical protein CG709_05195 [Lachnotalea glycerini]
MGQTSEDVGYNIPAAENFAYACLLLKCKKQEIIHIGDSQVDDIFAGGRAGIHTIWINRNLEELKEEIIPPITTLSDLKDLIGELM